MTRISNIGARKTWKSHFEYGSAEARWNALHARGSTTPSVASDIDDSPTLFLVLLEDTDGRTPSVSSRFGSKLPLPLYADAWLHILMTRHYDAGHHPYTLPPNSITYNKLRTAAIWMDECVNGNPTPNLLYSAGISLNREDLLMVPCPCPCPCPSPSLVRPFMGLSRFIVMSHSDE